MPIPLGAEAALPAGMQWKVSFIWLSNATAMAPSDFITISYLALATFWLFVGT